MVLTNNRMTGTLQNPPLLTIPPRLSGTDEVLVRVELTGPPRLYSATVRLVGGERETTLPLSQVREVMPLRAGSERTYRVPCWLARRLKNELE